MSEGTAKVTISGMVEGVMVSISYDTALDGDLFNKVSKTVAMATAAGWSDPRPAVRQSGWSGGAGTQKSRLELDMETKRVKLFPTYAMIGVSKRQEPDEEARKAKQDAKRAAFVKAVQGICGEAIPVTFQWNADDPKSSFYWVGIKYARDLWQSERMAEWEKTPPILPNEVING